MDEDEDEDRAPAGGPPAGGSQTGGSQTGSPLDGCLVADFSRVLAGPLATMVLGDLGATVVKVEHPAGDDTRRWGPPFLGPESTYYLSVNRNKRSVVLDLSTQEGQADAVRLAERATVFVENFRPGRLAAFGLAYDQLADRNPGLVYCSISGFGGEGSPGADLAGYDFVVQAVSGLMDITGPQEGPPSKVGVAVVDVLTGLQAAIGILAALQARGTSGRGQRVEVSLFGTALAALVNQASAYLNAGVVPRAMGNRHPSITPYETLAAADGELAVAVGNDAQFAALCAALGRPSLAADARFGTNPDRVAHRAELTAALETLMAHRTVDDWVAALRASGIPCGQVNDVAAAFAEAERLGLAPVSIPGGNGQPTVRTVANPLALSRTPVRYRRPPPALGQDTDEVLAWLDDEDAATPLGP
jgi:crotonobetainyl-CoA:carnitine CoA-transferase CaiB-like acyl-CoA transferase